MLVTPIGGLTLLSPGWLWLLGPIFLIITGITCVADHRAGLRPQRIFLLHGLRFTAIMGLLFLLARPAWSEDEVTDPPRSGVVILVDRSESMSLDEGGAPRLNEARALLRNRLLPALRRAQIRSRAFVFAEDARQVNGEELAREEAKGQETDLANAILTAQGSQPERPLAVIALSDGVTTVPAAQGRAIAAMVRTGTPFIGIGFGSELGARTLSIAQTLAPAQAGLNQTFRISAQLETSGAGAFPPFTLGLFRDGKLMQSQSVTPGTGARTWLSGFDVAEKTLGTQTYQLKILGINDPALRIINEQSLSVVRISEDKEIRVLYAQGALTWDYKFLKRALEGDPLIKVTGLSRTSGRSFLVQDDAQQLTRGFPAKLEELAPYRVLVLSNLRPEDLSQDQQEILARYCAEYGGGVLIIGGPKTFDGGWKGSRLEQMLPVRFLEHQFRENRSAFRLELTPEARTDPVFQVADPAQNSGVWRTFPTLDANSYGRIESVKPGAKVWATHPSEFLDDGAPRPLIAVQPFGAGQSMVIATQNFWRWGLAKETPPDAFQRFWKQLFRQLAQGNREDLTLTLPDQDLRPGGTVRVLVERRPKLQSPTAVNPPNAVAANAANAVATDDTPLTAQLSVTQENNVPVLTQKLMLRHSRPAEIAFPAKNAGAYEITVTDPAGTTLATKNLMIQNVRKELIRTARDLETLRQWASLTRGLAIAAENCDNCDDLIERIRQKAEEAQTQSRESALPFGIPPWLILLTLGPLCLEWILRRRYGLR